MQRDMHYYGTYVLARAAGLKKDIAKVIATTSQFVDDNAKNHEIVFKDAGSIHSQATAHHAINIKNIDPIDQRQIWVPFHFLPGNEGESFTERLICRKNSPIAQEMVRHNLSQSKKPFYRELMGITAHVYADTFAHYGFSGASSRKNRIVFGSIKFHEIDPKLEKYLMDKYAKHEKESHEEMGFMENIKSFVAEKFSGALGHGPVEINPDRPYLKWSYEYEDSRAEVTRDNTESFLQGCEALFKVFAAIGKISPDFAEQGDPKSFKDMKSTVRDILMIKTPTEGRIEAWKDAVKNGLLFKSDPDGIPEYSDLNREFEALDKTEDSKVATEYTAYRFAQASSFHRNYVLRELLPKYKLVVA
jgi:hypothetical protein